MEHTHNIPKDKIIALLELVLNNCVFSFQNKIYKQLQGAVIDSPVSPVIANIYMEYFEKLALRPHYPIPIHWWKRYVDGIICITKKVHVNIIFDYINLIDDHITFTMEHPDKEVSIPFLDTKCTSHPSQ